MTDDGGTLGNTDDLLQRYTLRVLVYEADKLTYQKFCTWGDIPFDPDEPFHEQPDAVRVVRDLSTVEELQLMLAMTRALGAIFDEPRTTTREETARLAQEQGKLLREQFIAQHGYKPEESTTPYVPVTIHGPEDHDEYYAREYPPDPLDGVEN